MKNYFVSSSRVQFFLRGNPMVDDKKSYPFLWLYFYFGKFDKNPIVASDQLGREAERRLLKLRATLFTKVKLR